MPYKDKESEKAGNRRKYLKNRESRLAKAVVDNARIRARVKVWMDEVIQPCIVCGEDENCCIDFHHTNPEEKLGRVPRMARGNRQKFLAEVAKCVCLCANCHRKVHAGVITLE
jgi:hypothetical protein